MLTVSSTALPRLLALMLAAAAAWLCAPSAAHAIVNGTTATTFADRSTVFVRTSPSGGCSGTLVAPDLVLTSGHCIYDKDKLPDPAPHDRFRDLPEADWQRPDRFYDVPNEVTVSVGLDRTDPELEPIDAPSYALPGRADMVLLRLAQSVPASVATPVPILTRPPGRGVDPPAWFAGLEMQVAGFGDTDDDDPFANSERLMLGRVDSGELPCAGDHAHKLCVESADDSGVRQGDSGGPLYWTDEYGVRWVVGVFQTLQPPNGGRYIATFYRGGSKADRTNLSNIGGWLDQFVRGRPGGLAFVRTTDWRVHDVSDRTHASNPSGLGVSVQRETIGRTYEVRFDGLRHTDRREPRVATVTAFGNDAEYCKLADAEAADLIRVACFDSDGTRAYSRFSLATDISDSDLLVRVPRLSSGATSVPSAHGAVSVTRIAAGTYKVVAPGYRGDGLTNVMATAEGPDNTRCNVQASSSSAPATTIRCARPDGLAADSGFTLAATSGTDSAYALAHQTVRSSYVATPARANVPGTAAKPTIERLDIGRYRVTFTGAPANAGGNVHAVAYGSTSNYCKVEAWTDDSADVQCRDTNGTLADTMFLVRYLDPLDAGRRVEVTLRELHATSEDDCGEMDFYGTLAQPGVKSVDVPLVSNRDVRVFASPVGLIINSAPGQQLVEAELRVRDQDGSCGSSSRDDEVDITPGWGTRLRLQIDVQAHTVRVLDAFPQVLGGLGLWGSDGNTGDETARAEIDVDIMSPTGL
jgi:Trypsin